MVVRSVPASDVGPDWRSLPAVARIAGDEVHLWRLRLAQPSSVVARLRETLSDDERERADRAASALAAGHFAVARGALRTVLASYLSVEPRALAFAYGPRGKPALASDGGLRFNVAHSHGLALVAVARGRELGVDLERVRPLPAAEAIARRFFSAGERAAPLRRRLDAFLSLWTRKEAYLKATGGGLRWGRALAAVDVSDGLEGWTIRELTPARGFRSALVVEGDGWELATWQWRPPDPPGRPPVGGVPGQLWERVGARWPR